MSEEQNANRVVIGMRAVDEEHVEVCLSCGPMRAIGYATIQADRVSFDWKLDCDEKYTTVFQDVVQELEKRNAFNDKRIIELARSRGERKDKDKDDVTTFSNSFIVNKEGLDFLSGAIEFPEQVSGGVFSLPAGAMDGSDGFKVVVRGSGYPKLTYREGDMGDLLKYLGAVGKPRGPVVVTQTAVSQDASVVVRVWTLSEGKVHYSSFPITNMIEEGFIPLKE